MRTRVVIQSRLSSSRLPGKALMTVGGMPLVELVARRASRTGFEVVVATSVEMYDDRIAATLQPVGIRVLRGSLDDVLSRFLDATSDLAEDDRVVRLTGDNPVADADLVQELIDEMDRTGREYGRVDIDVVPEGLGVEVFPVRLLRQAGREAVDSYDREHVTPWIRRHTDELLFAPRRNPGKPAVYRATVDCLHDFIRVSRLFDGYADPVTVPWADVMDSLVGHVRALGPIANAVPDVTPRLTTLVLGVDNLGWNGKEHEAATIREVFTRAVEAGVSHVVCTADAAHLVATGLLPMLKQRMGVSVVLPSVVESPAPELELRYRIERARTESGHAALRTVFLQEADLVSEHAGALLDVLADYRERNVLKEIGAVVKPHGALKPGAITEVSVAATYLGDDAAPETLAEWHSAGAITVGIAPPEAKQTHISDDIRSDAIDAVVVQPVGRRELTSLLTAR